MKGFVGISHSDQIETAIAEATAGLKKADFLVLIAPFSKAEQAAALLGEKYPGTPMIGTSGECIAKQTVCRNQILVIGFAGVEVCTGILENVRSTPVKSMHTFLEHMEQIEPGNSNTICLEFVTGCEERVLATMHADLQNAGIPLIGASAYGVPLGERHIVIYNGKLCTRSCVYAFLKNKGGSIRLYKENIYERQSSRAHFATLVEPGTRTLFQLDELPALEVYQNETGIEIENLVSSMPYHPLGRALGEDTCLIQTMSVDRNGVMFNGKAIYENDSIYIMRPGNYADIHASLLARIQEEAAKVSFLLGFDSSNRLRLFAEEDYRDTYVSSFSQIAPTAIFVGDGQQLHNMHMNQTLVIAAFE